MLIMLCGYEIQIDPEDVSLLEHNWFAAPSRRKPSLVYFRRNIRVEGVRVKIQLHREIMNAPPGSVVDHINGNTLDNRKSNLRLCGQRENAINSCTSSRNKSGTKGVTWKADHKKWRAQIKIGETTKHLGYFSTKEEAEVVYKDYASKFFGEYVRV